MDERKPQILFKLIAVNIFIFLIVAAFIEVCGQIYVYFHPSYKVIPFEPHPILGWRFIPSSEHIITGHHWYAREFSSKVKINSHGFRDFERTIEKGAKTVRIALLGDSMIAARQLEFEKTAGQLLEKRLNNELNTNGYKYEVLNFGVPGYGIDQILLNWTSYVSKFKPDFVFVYIFEKNYLRTISTTWCQREFFGINDLGEKKCLDIRPVVTLKTGRPEALSVEEGENFVNDFLYIKREEFQRLKARTDRISYIDELPFQIFIPKDFQKFVDQQKEFIKKEMNGKRSLEVDKKSFLLDLMSNLRRSISKFFNKHEEEVGIYYGAGDKKNFPSWMTTNLVNLKTLKMLGNQVLDLKKDFIVMDSFQFHNDSIPPIRLASNWLNELSNVSNYGYIPIYEKLNRSKDQGRSLTWKYDPHLNEVGNKVFADAMFEYLNKKITQPSN